ncbi:MAG: Epoxyqueuosine reductase [Fibrobacterota bacterium]
MSGALRQILSELLADCPWEWGLAALSDADAEVRRQKLSEWTGAGHHGTLHWLAQSQAVRADPRKEWPWAKSALVVRRPHPLEPAAVDRGERPLIACYARGIDYHRVLEEFLRALATRLKERIPALRTLSCVDVMPLPEVDLAVKAGLGWRGKHTLLLSRHAGSAANLGVLLLSEEIEQTPPMQDFCGTCTACLDACPTQALVAPGRLDARLCLSHWNIEDRESSEGPAARAVQGEVLGCDLCQQACPWNRRHLTEVPSPAGWPSRWEDWVRILKPAGGSGPLTKRTPLERVGRAKLRQVLLRALENIDPAKAETLRREALEDETHPRLREWLEQHP